ncbi:serine hydrolase domain-containing protein [Pseudonocardia abyssalis]|uniref:Beta-lactamase family protein n=1 Tax=Pseudonocardia abyssalis TaxID=2792008 RepID=A0ABS6V0I0_9PSEU|nr:serine hydrolase domain-containing protein [Pseudonocardia abyssalis]MBW0115966.1 beta-lactamase family protein [Pseudonocardia abyssalis]MBW0138001.1 beta-lactamase family protein [Pseudonocardia abyssalis]
MAELKVDAEPAEVGFDPDRLGRIDAHFARYVDDGRLAGWTVAVARRDRVVHLSHHGLADVEAARPVGDDTLWRIYSMTKPVTSVAALMLYERGLIALTDPVSRYIPAFADLRVYRGGSAADPGTEPAAEPVRIWHLLTHTAGLTYGFHHAHPVDEAYRSRGFEFGVPAGMDLTAACDAWASLPLVHQPGAEWNYSVATDVLGRVVEVASGRSLDAFLTDEILRPLDMTDTGFGAADPDRLAALYVPRPGGGLHRHDRMGDAALRAPTFLSGGGGLVSTAADYHRFTRMLARGGEVDGVRLLGSRTVAYATRNHLPGNVDLQAFGRPIFAESTYHGVGFGLGFSVVVDPAAGKALTSTGEYAWGGLASTAFYVDPVEEITAMFFTQLMPSSTYPIRPQLRTLVTQALVA